MATFYLDPISGNDANSGNSFANRWQSITTGATLARIAPGDTIRVIASPDATSLGQSASWTDGSKTVTLTTAVTAVVSAATAAWTTVTNTTSTTSTNRKLGSTSSSLSVNGTFATGKSHYTALGGATDFSGYQQITFWIMQTAGTLASGDGEISLKLCSDTAGATAVNTFNIPRIRSLNQWQAYTINLATNLGSSIQSVGFYINSDRGAQTFLLNNILAVKASSSADSLSLTSLIGKNSGTEGWFSIDNINGTAIALQTAGSNYNLSLAGTPSGYSGTTESVTTYKREPLSLPSARVSTSATGTTWGLVNDSGSSGSPITFSGGWNRTDMSTQTGDTYISGVNGLGKGMHATSKTYIIFDKMNFCRFTNGYDIINDSNNIIVTAKDVSCNNGSNVYVGANVDGSAGPKNLTITIDNINCAGSDGGNNLYLYRSVKNCEFTFINSNSAWNYGFLTFSSVSTSNPFVISKIKANFTNIRRAGTEGINAYNLVDSYITIGTLQHNADRNIALRVISGGSVYPGCYRNKFRITDTCSDVSAIGILIISSADNIFDFTGAVIQSSIVGVYSSGGTNKIIGGTFSSNSSSDIVVDGSAQIICSGTTLSSTTPYALWESGVSKISFQKYQNTADDHRHYFGHGSILSNTSTRHTASGISWKMSPTSTVYVDSNFPLTLPVGRIAVNASALVTAKVWVYRDNTGITTKFVCKGGQIAGVSSDVTTTAAGSASAWEELTITFTPSEAGTVELEVQVYGGTTYSTYVDDLTVTQA